MPAPSSSPSTTAFACLSAYDPAYAALKHAKLERLLEKEETSPDAQLEYQQRNLMAFAATEEVPYDSSGRIVFPPMMRRKGQIGELALFLGAGETFQIWNPKLLLDDKRIPEDLKDIARFRLEERGAVMTSAGATTGPTRAGAGRRGRRGARLARGETAVDGTFGAGGYTRAMLAAGAGRVIGFDRDPDAIEAGPVARPGPAPDPRRTSASARWTACWPSAASAGRRASRSISASRSMQLDRAERGFSFQADGPLDMRMSKSGLTAAEFLNQADEAEIARVLEDYGEEPRARAIARAIVAARPLERTAELAAIVRRAAGFRPGQKSDPATRTFQAIRIHLNAELDELEQGLAAAERVASARRPAGRGHLSQPRGPDREALLPRTQRRNAGRFAPPSCAGRPARTDVRAGRQAGIPDGARAGREPARALGPAAERGPHRPPRHGRKQLQ